MRSFVLFLLVALCVFSCALSVHSLSGIEKDKITNGLEVGKKFLDLVTSKEDFGRKLLGLANAVSDFLGSAGPIVKFILSFIKLGTPESAELKYMKQQFAIVKAKLDTHTHEFQRVKALIHWSTLQISFIEDERTILTMEHTLNQFMTAEDDSVKKASMERFKHQFKSSTVRDPGFSLYNAVMLDDQVFTKNIVKAAMRFTENRRKSVQDFMIGVTQLITRASKLEISYYQMQYEDDSVVENRRVIWASRMRHLENKMRSLDAAVESQWAAQMQDDVTNYSSHHVHVSNRHYAVSLYNILQEKFYWRNWLVVAYNPIWGGDNHWILGCHGGTVRFRFYGRNIFVASTPRNHVYNNVFSDQILREQDRIMGGNKKAVEWSNKFIQITNGYRQPNCHYHVLVAFIRPGHDTQYGVTLGRLAVRFFRNMQGLAFG